MKIIETVIANALEKIKSYFIEPDFPVDIKIILTNNKIDCHYCSNVLFSLRRNLKENFEEPFRLALLESEFIDDVKFVNGYVNLKMSPKFFMHVIENIANEDIFPNVGNGVATNVEYCSINPTGFLHIGHARNAILGDAIARILSKANFKVTKEYYVNDAGNQVKLLAQSIFARILEAKNLEFSFPENGYTGVEMIEIAKKIIDENAIDFSLLDIKNEENKEALVEQIQQYALNYFLNQIKQDLKDLKVDHDIFSSEKEIAHSGYIEKAIELLRSKNYLYEGARDAKKATKGKISNDTLLLLKTTEFGDDEDRPLTKSDGSWTYLAPDIGYHMNKIERGFEYLICVLGADHDSYAHRIKIAVKALKEDIRHETPICQMVSFELDGKNVKFSKRLGNSIRTHDFIQEVDVDVLRFMMLAKAAGTPFSFDYENATTMSMKNPVFYIQYAHARGCSILRNAGNVNAQLNMCDAFAIPEFQEVIVLLSNFKNVVRDAALQLAPHTIATYSQKLAEGLHKLWQMGKVDNSKRFIVDANQKETAARLFIVSAYLKILRECLEMLGVAAPESMQ